MDGERRVISLRRRIEAVLALVATPVGAVLALVGFVLGLPELLLAALVLAPAPAFLWRALGRRGTSRWSWVIASFGLGFVSLWLVWSADRGVGLVFAGALLVLLGGGSAAAALYHVPRSEQSRLPRSRHRVERPVLFVNPRSGGGTAVRTNLVAEAEARGVRVVLIEPGVDLRALARAAVDGGADCLGAAGGDGTMAVVADVACEYGVPFVCVPAGTRNHFALDLGLDRTDPVEALGAFVRSNSMRVDLARVNGHTFVNNVSVGVYGEVVADEQYRGNKLGTALQRLPDLVGPGADPLGIEVVDDTGRRHTDAVVLLVSNNRYELSPRPGFGSRPSLRDGELGVVLVQPGAGLLGPVEVSTWQTPTLEVTGARTLNVGLDGESIQLEPPLRFRVLPGVLRVRLPVSAPGLSPSALRPRLGPERVGELWSIAQGVPPGSLAADPLP